MASEFLPPTGKKRTIAEMLFESKCVRDRNARSEEGSALCMKLARAEPVDVKESDVTRLIELAVDAYASGVDPNYDDVCATTRTDNDSNVVFNVFEPNAVVFTECVLWMLTASRARIRSRETPAKRLAFVTTDALSPKGVGRSFTSAVHYLDAHVAAIGTLVQPTKRVIDTIIQYHLHMRFLWYRCLNDMLPLAPRAESWRKCALRHAIDHSIESSRSDPTLRTRIGNSIRYSHTDLGEYARSLVDSPDDARALGIQVAFQRCALHGTIAFRGMSITDLAGYDQDATDMCVYESLFSMHAPPGADATSGAATQTVRAGIVNMTHEFSQYVIRFSQWGSRDGNAIALRARMHGRPALPVIAEIGRGRWAWVVIDRTRKEYTFVGTALDALAEWEYRVHTHHGGMLERVAARPMVHESACVCVPPARCRFEAGDGDTGDSS